MLAHSKSQTCNKLSAKGMQTYVTPQLVETQTLVIYIGLWKRHRGNWKSFQWPQAVAATLLYLLASIPHPTTHYAVEKTTTHMEVLQT